MIINNIGTVKRAITVKTNEIDLGAKAARDEMMASFIQFAKEEIKGKRPKGQKATTGEPPMNRTGNLRRSITGEKNRIGFANYTALVGPTMVYGRAVELGGKYGPKTWRNNEHFPYMQPAFNKFQRIAMLIIHKHLG